MHLISLPSETLRQGQKTDKEGTRAEMVSRFWKIARQVVTAEPRELTPKLEVGREEN